MTIVFPFYFCTGFICASTYRTIKIYIYIYTRVCVSMYIIFYSYYYYYYLSVCTHMLWYIRIVRTASNKLKCQCPVGVDIGQPSQGGQLPVSLTQTIIVQLCPTYVHRSYVHVTRLLPHNVRSTAFSIILVCQLSVRQLPIHIINNRNGRFMRHLRTDNNHISIDIIVIIIILLFFTSSRNVY